MIKKICALSFVFFIGLTGCTGAAPPSGADFHIGALRGPTAMGMVKMMADADEGVTAGDYTFAIAGAADEITVGLLQGDIDIAAVPCNLASVLYNRSEGEIQVAAINTLGVLYILETGGAIHEIGDLKGRTLYTTGKGTTPEYSLAHILKRHGLDPENDLTIEYLAEATEAAALFNSGGADLVMLPQPYAASVLANNAEARIALDLNEEWAAVEETAALVTGVVAVRKEVAEKAPEALNAFLADYADSVAYVNAQPGEAAQLIEKYDIAAANIAKKAIPDCNIVFITGSEMADAINGYLEILYEANSASIGGTLPDSDFYIQ